MTSTPRAAKPQLAKDQKTTHKQQPAAGGTGVSRSSAKAGNAEILRASRRQECYDSQFYKTKLCTFWQRGKCMRQNSCKFAHGEEERHQAPDLNQTSMCHQMLTTGKCDDPNCQYAHDAGSLRATNIFYKTTMCYFYRFGTCKLGAACRHAHSKNELRVTLGRSGAQTRASSKAGSVVGSEASTVAPSGEQTSETPITAAPDNVSGCDLISQAWSEEEQEGQESLGEMEEASEKASQHELSSGERSTSLPCLIYTDAAGQQLLEDEDLTVEQAWSRSMSAPANVVLTPLAAPLAATAPMPPSPPSMSVVPMVVSAQAAATSPAGAQVVYGAMAPAVVPMMPATHVNPVVVLETPADVCAFAPAVAVAPVAPIVATTPSAAIAEQQPQFSGAGNNRPQWPTEQVLGLIPMTAMGHMQHIAPGGAPTSSALSTNLIQQMLENAMPDHYDE